MQFLSIPNYFQYPKNLIKHLDDQNDNTDLYNTDFLDYNQILSELRQPLHILRTIISFQYLATMEFLWQNQIRKLLNQEMVLRVQVQLRIHSETTGKINKWVVFI